MSILDIRVLGDPVLRKPTKRVTEVTDELRNLIADMFETMYAAEGIGLAAPQVGRTERLAIVDVDGARFVLINPEIVSTTGTELLGRCFQHEIDHLDGKLFIDYLSTLKRRAAMTKWEKAKAEYPGFIRKVRAEVKGEHHHANETEM